MEYRYPLMRNDIHGLRGLRPSPHVPLVIGLTPDSAGSVSSGLVDKLPNRQPEPPLASLVRRPSRLPRLG